MKHIEPSLHPFQEPGWQRLGEQVLPAGIDIQDAVCAWLAALLRPLDLHDDFLNKLLHSAKDAARRAALAASVEQTGHLHILVYVRSDAPAGRTWGFFRIEKIEDLGPEGAPPGHAIDFYLYPEGH